MDDADRWYFTKDQLANTPSRKCGITEARELSFRQQAANFIQDMGQRLQVNQLCINTAIVYMHRFYVFHSFTEIHRNKLSLSALFLAAKVEEQPRKLEHLIKVAHACLHKDLPPLDVRSEAYQEKMFEVVAHENILLQTLGFVLAIEHPHTYVVKVCQLVKASKDLAQTSYIMATTSLHMTTMCLMYKPTVVACVCIHLACKWSDWRIEPCSEGRDWFFYVDRTVTNEKLETLTDRFIAIMETSPHRFRKKFGQKDINYHGPRSLTDEPSTSKAGTSSDFKQDLSSPGPSGLSYDFADFDDKPLFRDRSPTKPHFQPSVPPPAKPSTPVQQLPSSVPTSHPKKSTTKAETPHSISLDVYREKREKERLQSKVPAPLPADSPSMHPQIIKKPLHAFHETERVPHRTTSKQSELPAAPTKERGSKVAEIKEDPLDHSTSVNKINHQLTKVNFDGSHHKERPGYTHTTKIPHQTYEPVIKHEKIEPIVQLERVDLSRPEKINVSKPEKRDLMKHERIEIGKQEKADLIKQERVESVKHERADSVKREKTESVKQERVESLKREITELVKHEITESLKQDRVDSIKPERVDLIKHEKDMIPQERIDVIKQEKVDIKQERVKTELKNSLSTSEIPCSITRPSHKSEAAVGVDVVKKERREKHKKHSSHSSKEKSTSNHLERAPSAGIKVKIPKTVINLSGIVPESSQKYASPSKPESPKRSLKIKIAKPPESSKAVKPSTPTLKLVITKDKSGTGSYSTSHKNERESRKRVHSNSVSDGNGKTLYDAPSSKHQKVDHSQKSHHSSASGSKPSKSSRHSSHRSGEHSFNESGYGAQQHPANGNNALNAQSYSQGFMYNFTPPPQPPKMKAYGMPTGKTNSNPPLPPPLPPPPPPPPE